MNGQFAFDDVDRAIIELLRKHGRATNQEIADCLRLTAATVSARIRRMEDANKLHVVAVSDFSAHGLSVLIPATIEVDGRPAEDVARQLIAFPEVFAAHLVTGPHDVDVLLAFKDYGDVREFMLGKLAQVEGIRAIVPAIAVDVLKYRFDVAPIQDVGVAE